MQKGEDPTDYKDFDPYVDIKKSIKDGYRDISVVKGTARAHVLSPGCTAFKVHFRVAVIRVHSRQGALT